jgi:hypothetical protein
MLLSEADLPAIFVPPRVQDGFGAPSRSCVSAALTKAKGQRAALSPGAAPLIRSLGSRSARRLPAPVGAIELGRAADRHRSPAPTAHGLFVGDVRVDACLDDGLSEPAKRDLGLSQLARLFRCSCGGWFIAHWSAKQCLACRKAAVRSRQRAHTAKRSAERAERRESRQAGRSSTSR